MSLRFCKRPTWWHSNLPYTNADIEKPEQVECEIGGNKFTSYAAVMKDGKDVICGRVTSVLKDAIGFGDAFVDWAVKQTLEFLRNRIKSFEEYSPAVMHIKGIHNTVADAISRLDFCPVQEEKTNWMMFTQCWCHYTMQTPTEESTTNQQQPNKHSVC